MTFRPLSAVVRSMGRQSPTGGAQNSLTGLFADLPAPVGTDAPRRPPTHRATHRAVPRPFRGSGPAGHARSRPGVRPGGAAGTSPGTTSSARHGRPGRGGRGADAGTAAASRLRADALMAAD